MFMKLNNNISGQSHIDNVVPEVMFINDSGKPHFHYPLEPI